MAQAYELDITLAGARPRIWRRITIAADATFGDGWLHDIRVVRRIGEPVDYRRQLLDGARAFPPEDCGGLPGYEQCVEVATGGDDPYDRREWLGDWDPERFDLAELKQRFDR